MKKKDLKKLAMLGIAGGSIVASQAGASEVTDLSNYSHLLAASCGGSQGGCHSSSSQYNYPRYSNAQYYNSQQYQQTSSCAGMTQPGQYQQASSCGGMSQPTQRQPSSSCAGMTQPTQRQASNSCAGMTQPTQRQVSSSCGGMSQPANQQTAQPQPTATQPTQQSAMNQRSSSCAGMTQPRGQQPSNTYASGCGGRRAPQSYPQGPQSSCASTQQAYNYRPAPSNTRPGSPQVVTSWDPQSSSNYYFQDQPYQGQTAEQPQRGQPSNAPASNPGRLTAEANTQVTRPQLNESQLINLLNPEGLALYNNMDPAGKALALKLVNMTCKGSNECNGLNACKSDKNTCAGKGAKGSTPGPFKDVNSAVKVASKKMGEKRTNAVGN